MKGPRKQFDKVHILRTLFILEQENEIGRKELVKKLGIGEGSVRGVLDYLSEKDYVTSAVAKGHQLTTKGKEVIKKIHALVAGPQIVDAKELTVGEKNVAVLVRDAANHVSLGIHERDAAIKIGSLGATVLIVKNNQLLFPGESEVTVGNEELHRLFSLRNGDVILIGTDTRYDRAENAAVAGLLTLIGEKINRLLP